MQWNPWAAIRQRDKQIDFLNRELALCRQLAREGRREIERLKFHLKISNIYPRLKAEDFQED